MVRRQRDLLRVLASSRGHSSIVALCAASKLPRIALYRVCGGVARDTTVAKVARALGVSVSEIHEIIAVGRS